MVEGHLLSDVIAINAIDRHRDGRDRPMSARRIERRAGGAMSHGPSRRSRDLTATSRTSRCSPARRARSSTSCSTRYPTKMAALLPALWMVQDAARLGERRRHGRSRRGARAHAGVREGRRDVLHDVPPASGREALHPGVHDVAVQRVRRRRCREGVPRAHRLRRARASRRADGKFTVIEVECLGACGFATPVMINDDFIESRRRRRRGRRRFSRRDSSHCDADMGYPHKSHARETAVLSKYFGDAEARHARRLEEARRLPRAREGARHGARATIVRRS